MKKGKTIKLSGFDRAKVLYGTVDCKNLKSIYLNIQTWGLPKSYKENWNKTILLLQREIKSNVLDVIDKTILQDKIIVDLDMRSSGVQVGKKSFMNFNERNEMIDNKQLELHQKEMEQIIEDLNEPLLP